jgi:hypothetical protein
MDPDSPLSAHDSSRVWCRSPFSLPRPHPFVSSPRSRADVALLPRHPRALPPQIHTFAIPTHPPPDPRQLPHRRLVRHHLLVPIKTTAQDKWRGTSAGTAAMEYAGILVLWACICACVSDDGLLHCGPLARYVPQSCMLANLGSGQTKL